VVVHRACVEVVDIRYDKGDQYNSKGYAYKVNPNLDERYNWFAEELLYKYTAKPASIIPLLCAATEPVQQPRRRGRLPKNIASVWVARYKRRCQDEELSKLREVLRDLNISIEIDRKIIGEQRAKLIEVKGKIQELLR
jgi:hypothetical protein